MFTDGGKPEVSEDSLSEIDSPFVRDYVKYMSLQKVLGTSLKGIADEVDSNVFLHPSFNLNTVQTYRSSSSDPNFQNIPARYGKLVGIVRPARDLKNPRRSSVLCLLFPLHNEP